MKSWPEFRDETPELAAAGEKLLLRKRPQVGGAFIATLRKDGAPRLHPISVVQAQDRLYIIIPHSSPKCADLLRDGRYAIHCAVSDNRGASGEFIITGRAHLINNLDLRALAVSLASYAPADRYILFEFDIESAASTIYPDDQPVRRFWKRET